MGKYPVLRRSINNDNNFSPILALKSPTPLPPLLLIQIEQFVLLHLNDNGHFILYKYFLAEFEVFPCLLKLMKKSYNPLMKLREMERAFSWLKFLHTEIASIKSLERERLRYWYSKLRILKCRVWMTGGFEDF